MKNNRVQSFIKPKISTMPRNKSEASQQLELYKLITEQQRIQKELKFIEQRTHHLKNRLTVLSHQIESTEQNIQDLRQGNFNFPKAKNNSISSVSGSNFQAFYLEY